MEFAALALHPYPARPPSVLCVPAPESVPRSPRPAVPAHYTLDGPRTRDRTFRLGAPDAREQAGQWYQLADTPFDLLNRAGHLLVSRQTRCRRDGAGQDRRSSKEEVWLPGLVRGQGWCPTGPYQRLEARNFELRQTLAGQMHVGSAGVHNACREPEEEVQHVERAKYAAGTGD